MFFRRKFAVRLAVTAAILGALCTAAPRAWSGKTDPGHSAPRDRAETGSPGLSPSERFAVFTTIASRARERQTGLSADTTAADRHPIADFLLSSLWPFAADEDTLPRSVIDSVTALWRRTTPAFPDTSERWMQDALFLGRGLYRLGLAGDAMEWLLTVDGSADDTRLRAQARRLMVYHYAVTMDSAGTDYLARTWTVAIVQADEGGRATLALLCALYLRGDWKLLRLVAAPFPQFAAYVNLFEAGYLCAEGRCAEAQRASDSLLKLLAAERSIVYPVSMVMSALLLSADADWANGMDGLAEREYAELSKLDHAFVKAWSLFMLGAVAMHNDDYEMARERFERMCQSSRGEPWQSLGCALIAHSQQMSEIRRGKN